MRSGRGGQAELDGVEVLEGVSPDGDFLTRVATMTFIGNDEIECMDRDGQGRRIIFRFTLTSLEHCSTAEQVDGEALDRADENERLSRFRIGEVCIREHVRVVCVVVLEVTSLEALGVDLVDLIELETRLRLERSEGAGRLCSQCTPVDEEENAAGDARLHQAIDLVNEGEGLAGSGRHRNEHATLSRADGVLDRDVRVALIRAQSPVKEVQIGQRTALAFEVTPEGFMQCRRSVKVGHRA